MESLELALVAAGLVAGLTGTWSPCGFSMIETIGPVGHAGGRATTLAACLAFTLGALAGGAATFGLLASLGAVVHGADDGAAYVVAAAIALAAAAAEARGLPIVPQVRRQLPEHWRRLMPMPLAAALYGVLLGLGFTTFVLTFGVFALAGIAFAVGEPVVGATVGLAFGIGRALPIALTAPVADRPSGARVIDLMAGRPSLYRGLRIGDGLALVAVAAALVVTVPATASRIESRPAADPSVGGDDLAFQRPDRSGVLRRGGAETPLPGRDPALGDGRVAIVSGDEIVLLSAVDLTETGRIGARGADAVAISAGWVAWRERGRRGDFIRASKVADPANPGPVKSLGHAGGAAQLGRPSLDGNRLVYAKATRRRNAIVKRVLGTGARSTVMRSRIVGLSNPSLRGRRLLYVRHEPRADELKLASLRGGEGRTLLRRRGGTLWSTALGRERAYVTQIHGTAPAQKILSAKRGKRGR